MNQQIGSEHIKRVLLGPSIEDVPVYALVLHIEIGPPVE